MERLALLMPIKEVFYDRLMSKRQKWNVYESNEKWITIAF